MDINWEKVADDYTDVPEELVPRLAELCRDENAGSLEEATAFILAVLQSHASYTLPPRESSGQ